MSEFKTGSFLADSGKVLLYFAQPWRAAPFPVVALIHGAMRTSNELMHWVDHLTDVADVLLIDLPGHGRSDPIDAPTLERFARPILQALRAFVPDRPVVLVGESLGGLISLAIGGMSPCDPVVGVLAADPPMTTKKLLHVHNNLKKVIAIHADPRFLKSMAAEIFGDGPEGAVERIYYPVLGGLRVPATIVAGDLELFPRRELSGVPCLIDSLDRFVLNRFYGDKVEVRQIKNSGHLLLVDQIEPCREFIRAFLAKTMAARAAVGDG